MRAFGAMVVVGLLGLSQSASADDFRKGPYLQNLTGTSVTVMWQLPSAAPGVVSVLGEKPRTIESGEARLHEVVIGDLEPGRRYRYTVESDGIVASGEFSTAPPSGEPFSFVVFGDSRRPNPGSHERVVNRVLREVPDFILGTGDMVDKGAIEADWQRFFEVERDLLKENTLFPSLGNHDRQGRGRTADNYRRYFSLPENSPDPERYYAFTFASARFLVLDSNAYSFALSDQTAWIEQQLQAARLDRNIEHIFVSMHHPPYSVSLHGGQSELREAWTPLFEKYQVSAVFSGHDHVYSRAEKNGVQYVVSGGGGAPLYPRKRSSAKIDVAATVYFERVNHYVRVSVIGSFIEMSAIRADGSIIETVAWGEPPRLDSKALLALANNPAASRSADKLAAVGGPAKDAPEVTARRGGKKSPGGGLSAFGMLGIVMAVVAGIGLVWTVRS